MMRPLILLLSFSFLALGCSGGGGSSASSALGAVSCNLPQEAQAENTSSPSRVIGNGSAASCTSQAVVSAIALGGIITFNCGANPIEIVMTATAKVVNSTGPKIVIDGGGKVTLSGGGARRILYMNTCDQTQGWTTSHCDNQDHPQLTVQNINFKNGNSKSETTNDGGGAIWVRGGRFKIINARFENNACADTGPDVGGGAVAVYSQFQNKPVYIVGSTFGGSSTTGNTCSNGGAISSIGVSYVIADSTFTHNRAIGNGANPAKPGTPGGGNGGSIYDDGNDINMSLCNSTVSNSVANEGGGAIFFVSSNRAGSLNIEDSQLSSNPSHGFETSGFPGIFYLGREAAPRVIHSKIE